LAARLPKDCRSSHFPACSQCHNEKRRGSLLKVVLTRAVFFKIHVFFEALRFVNVSGKYNLFVE